MTTAVTTDRCLVHESTWLHAVIERGSVLVHRSPLVLDNDPSMAVVWQELAGRCYTEQTEMIRDTGMMGRKAISSEYAVHLHCPGRFLPHDCADER